LNKKKYLQRAAQNSIKTSKLELAQTQFLHANPVCGDNVALKVEQADGTIIDIEHYTNSCAICNASINTLKEIMIGKTIPEVLEIIDYANIYFKNDVESKYTELMPFENIKNYPERYMCAYLPYHGLKKEISNEK
jgi:nitrogen fixation NifU-like protein